MERVAVVFVHGLFSSGHIWVTFHRLIEADQDLAWIELFDFKYPSPKFLLTR
jgi:hypothetical protein